MKTSLLLIVVWFSSAVPAWAEDASTVIPPGNDGLTERFRKADTNGDGVLSPDEARHGGFAFSNNFAAVDTDHNGTVTLFEIGEALQRTLSAWAADDTHGDGFITEEEAKKGPPSLLEIFVRVDRDRDHRVSRAEYETYTRSQLYRSVDMPSVYPNIIDKRF